MGDWCAWEDFLGGKDGERGERVCVTIFAHRHPLGGQSNIEGVAGGYENDAETKYIRKSVRMNLEAVVRGAGKVGMVDQWPD